jgi:energy-coupling factor transporter transmembrane protein EcfT
MAMVVDARAFGANQKRTMMREHQPTSIDRVAWGTLATLTITVIVLVSLHIGTRTN